MMVMQQQRRRDGRLSGHAYGGLYGKRETIVVLFLGKQNILVQAEDILDVLDYL